MVGERGCPALRRFGKAGQLRERRPDTIDGRPAKDGLRAWRRLRGRGRALDRFVRRVAAKRDAAQQVRGGRNRHDRDRRRGRPRPGGRPRPRRRTRTGRRPGPAGRDPDLLAREGHLDGPVAIRSVGRLGDRRQPLHGRGCRVAVPIARAGRCDGDPRTDGIEKCLGRGGPRAVVGDLQ